MRTILLSLLLCICAISNAQVSNLIGESVITKDFITIGYDVQKCIPNWVYELHTPLSLEGNVKRENGFYKDASIRNCISESIYSKSGYDKGHMAPAADFKFSLEAMYDSFSMLNIAPQTPTLNRQSWNALESYVRKIIAYSDTTYIITGHITGEYSGKIKNKVYIPKRFFKAIYAIKNNKCICSVSYIMLNTDTKQDYKKSKYSIDYVENIIHRDLFIGISKESNETNIILPF